MPALDGAGISTYEIEQFFHHLNASLQVLANATPQLRERSRDQFLSACELPARRARMDPIFRIC